MDDVADLELFSKDELIEILLKRADGGFNLTFPGKAGSPAGWRARSARVGPDGFTRWALNDEGKLRAKHFGSMDVLVATWSRRVEPRADALTIGDRAPHLFSFDSSVRSQHGDVNLGGE